MMDFKEWVAISETNIPLDRLRQLKAMIKNSYKPDKYYFDLYGMKFFAPYNDVILFISNYVSYAEKSRTPITKNEAMAVYMSCTTTGVFSSNKVRELYEKYADVHEAELSTYFHVGTLNLNSSSINNAYIRNGSTIIKLMSYIEYISGVPLFCVNSSYAIQAIKHCFCFNDYCVQYDLSAYGKNCCRILKISEDQFKAILCLIWKKSLII